MRSVAGRLLGRIMGSLVQGSKLQFRRHDQTGGAISLWVVLMTPVAAFAAVVAMAGPQRLAAESSIDETAADLAALSVVLLDGTGATHEELVVFAPDCLPLGSSNPDENELKAACELLLGDPGTGRGGYWLSDLGNLGIRANSWEGFYSGAVTASSARCVISASLETRIAVYVALAADWQDAGWAAAQVWPDGVRMGSEQVAMLNQSTTSGSPSDPCTDEFDPPFRVDSAPARTVFTN